MLLMVAKTKKRSGLRKFLILTAILLGYEVFVILKFGLKDGLLATALTWAFFVTCTPIADAGFIVDFPIRLVTGFKMFYSEIIVWVIAGLIIAGSFIFKNDIFEKLALFKLFKTILIHPWPLWSVIVVSCVGTFMSLHIGDQIYTIVEEHKHRKKIRKLRYQRLALELLLFGFVVGMYFVLLHLTGIKIAE